MEIVAEKESLRPTQHKDQSIADKERARDLKDRALRHAEALCAVMDEAQEMKMQLNVAFGRDNFGKNVVMGINVVKPII